MQTTSHILMIRPAAFAYNAETAVNNAFQSAVNPAGSQEQALLEFDQFTDLLRRRGVDVMVLEDTPVPHTPDSIFPNNWISFHADGSVLLYPMFARNRRAERKPHVLDRIRQRFLIRELTDLSGYEAQDLFLEGTGSMVLDRDNRLAYACLSPRTNREVLTRFCHVMNYTPVVFEAADSQGQAIYHTNVMMTVADKYAVICLESIIGEAARQEVKGAISRTGKTIIAISPEQMNHFAGNMLQVQNDKGEKILVMSTQAYASLTEDQRSLLSSFNPLLHSPLHTIETNGGGSARCMMAEIHLPLLERSERPAALPV